MQASSALISNPSPDAPQANDVRNPRIKGFLKDAFTGAAAGFAVTAAMKLAVSTSIRSMDITMGGGSALTGGLFNVWNEAKKDYDEARKITGPDQVFVARTQALKSIWSANKAKYGKKFMTGAGAGFAGAWGADLALDHADSIGSKLKEWTQPLRTFTSSIGEWVSTKWQAFKDIFSSTPPVIAAPHIPAQEIPDEPLHAAASNVIPFAPAQTQTLPAPEISNEPAHEPQEILIETVSTRDSLIAMATGPGANAAIERAVNGNPAAQKEVIDGLFNGRFGSAQNKELAAQITTEFSERTREKLAEGAKLSESEKQLLLTYAFMSYTPRPGIDHNPQESLDIIKRLGRSWHGAPELLAKVRGDVADIASARAVSAPASITEAMNCTANQNPPAVDPQFRVSCVDSGGAFKPGNTIGLGVNFHNGQHSDYTLKIGPKAEHVPKESYIEQAVSSALSQVKPPAPIEAPHLTAEYR